MIELKARNVRGEIMSKKKKKTKPRKPRVIIPMDTSEKEHKDKSKYDRKKERQGNKVTDY